MSATISQRVGLARLGRIVSVVVFLTQGVFLSGPLVAGGLVSTIEAVRPGIVAIGSVKKRLKKVSSNFSGTGFVVGDGTQVVTNYHVYRALRDEKKSGELTVFSGRGDEGLAHKAVLEQADPDHDLVLLRLRDARLQPLRLGSDDLLREGEDVAYTGFPIGAVLGLYPVTHRGMISAVTPIVIPADSSRRLTAEQILRIRKQRFLVYQLDGTAYPGNSGSPVYSPETGEVIAVINSVFVKGSKESTLKDPSGISYAIPVEHVRELLR